MNMKKLLTVFTLLLAFAAAPVAMAAPDSESLSKSQTKAIEKDAKKRCKELKKPAGNLWQAPPPLSTP